MNANDPIKQRRKLNQAIEQLDRKFARSLIIDDEVDPSIVSHHNLLRLLKLAVQSRDAPLVRKLLEQKPNLSSPEASQILWIVVEDGDTEIASMLVRAGADLNAPNFNSPCNSSFLHVLVKSTSPRKHQLAMLMLEHGADAKACNASGDSVLFLAVGASPVVLVEQLLLRGAEVDESVVWRATRHPEVARLLPMLVAKDCVDEDERNERIAMALIQVVYDGDDFLAAKALLDLGCPVDDMEYYGLTPLYTAVSGRRVKIVELLLDYGADVNKINPWGSSALYGASSLQQSNMAELLIRRGANIHNHNGWPKDYDDDGDGRYPIHAACAHESFENIQLLLRLGADINALDYFDDTPFCLMYAGYLRNMQLRDVHRLVIKQLAFLVSRGVEIQECDRVIIKSHLEMQRFFDDCTKELERMKDTRFFGNFSFYSLLDSSVKKLSSIIRNINFVDSYKESQRKKLFPLYDADMNFAFKNAERPKNELIETEKDLHEILGSILPRLVTDEIAYYLYWQDR